MINAYLNKGERDQIEIKKRKRVIVNDLTRCLWRMSFHQVALAVFVPRFRYSLREALQFRGIKRPLAPLSRPDPSEPNREKAGEDRHGRNYDSRQVSQVLLFAVVGFSIQGTVSSASDMEIEETGEHPADNESAGTHAEETDNEEKEGDT